MSRGYKLYRRATTRPGGGQWIFYYDRSIRMWTGLEQDAEGNNIPQYEGLQEAVYGETRGALMGYIDNINEDITAQCAKG